MNSRASDVFPPFIAPRDKKKTNINREYSISSLVRALQLRPQTLYALRGKPSILSYHRRVDCVAAHHLNCACLRLDDIARGKCELIKNQMLNKLIVQLNLFG